MATPEKPGQNLDQVLNNLYSTSVRRKDLVTDQSIEFVRHHFIGATGLTIPFHLNKLLKLQDGQWSAISKDNLPLLFVTAQEGSDTISVQNARQTISIVPSANPQSDKSLPHQIKFAGVIDHEGLGQRIVAASYSPYTGHLYNLQFSASEDEIQNPIAGEAGPHYSYVSHTDYQGYNQMVWDKNFVRATPTQQAGVITNAMMEEVTHEHFIHIYNPQRVNNADEPFHLPENLYTRSLGMTVYKPENDNRLVIGQLPQNILNEWQFSISDTLPVADPTKMYMEATLYPPEVPPIIDVWGKK